MNPTRGRVHAPTLLALISTVMVLAGGAALIVWGAAGLFS